jgi:polyferredoxin
MRHPDTIGPSLYEKHTTVHNKRIDGPFRRFKWLVMAVTLAIYYGTPWIRWDRGPYAPDQAVLVDLAHRRFYMFSIEIWPHEFYFVAGLLIMAGIGLFIVTSAVGERGAAIPARRRCGPICSSTSTASSTAIAMRGTGSTRAVDLGKVARRAFKWSIYLVIAFWTGGAWIMYFADAPTLTRDFWAGDAASAAYITVAILTPPPSRSAASCASRCASTCAPGRASSRR